MHSYSISLDEQETTINMYAGQISKMADVYSSVPSTVKKLRKYAEQQPEYFRIVRDTGNEIFAIIDRSCIRIAPKRRLSDEQREAATERLRNAKGGSP